MHILFENINYPTLELKKVIDSKFFIPSTSDNSKVIHVGYYNERDKGPVLILPKIFLINDCFLGIHYEKLLMQRTNELLDKSKLSIVNEIIIKFYLSIKKFYAQYSTEPPVFQDYSIVSNMGSELTTQLDVMLSIIDFSKKNPYIFMDKNINRNSSSAKKVKWNKVFNKKVGIVIDDSIIYPDFVINKKMQGNEDVLLVLYYNLLNELKYLDTNIFIPESVNLLSRKEFVLLKNKALNTLKKVKNRYFRDVYKRLWSLLYLYFDVSTSKRGNDKAEYLLISNYETVFEKMVDYLLSDVDVLKKYKHLKDNKEVDHLYIGKDIFSLGNIIHIGDSKYYSDPKNIRHTRFKQYTYAKNILMENIQLELDDKNDEVSLNYRDLITEGYNFTPNFFIYGITEDNLGIRNSIQLDEELLETSIHFHNRFFDRDTLHIFYFKINLVFLLDFYINKDMNYYLEHRAKVREFITEKIQEQIFSLYDFYIIENNEDNLSTIFADYKTFIGKVFISPFNNNEIIISLNKYYKDDNEKLLLNIEEKGISYKPFELLDFIEKP